MTQAESTASLGRHQGRKGSSKETAKDALLLALPPAVGTRRPRCFGFGCTGLMDGGKAPGRLGTCEGKDRRWLRR